MAAPDPDAEWWTNTDVAAYIGVSTRTVEAYTSRAQMPAPDQRYGRTKLWRPATIVEWHRGRRYRGDHTAD